MYMNNYCNSFLICDVCDILQMAGGQELAGSQEEEAGAGSAQEVEALLGVSEGDGAVVLRLQRGNGGNGGQHTTTYTW